MTAKCLLPTLGVLLVCGTSFAQPLPYSYDLPSPGSSTPWPGYSPGGAGMVVVEDHPLTTDYPVAETHPSHAAPAGQGCRCGDCCCNSMSCPGACCPAAFTAGPYGGAEFLWVRAHFSEALAFATGTVLGLQPFVAQVQGTELDFDYQASFRTFLGYHLSPATDIQFTYWRLDTSTDVNGAVLLPNQFIMDPFGHQANPGDSIFTNAEVNLNVYDFDVIRSTAVDESRLTLRYVAGIRVADIQQSYTSLINNPAAVLGLGTFNADFVGLGPHLGMQTMLRRQATSPLALVAKGSAALLVGDYDVTSSAFFNGAGGSQIADRTRLVPVLEGELGLLWQPSPLLNVTGGWMVQSWSNIGTSGGTFGNAFVQTDDSDIMSFDGLYVRGQVNF